VNSVATAAIGLVSCGVLSAALTAQSIRYARHRQLLDLPGRRRSHTLPTPRGGGIAIVLAMIAGAIAYAFFEPNVEYLPWLLPPIAGVAWVGWLDDHGGLSPPKRLAMHTFAAAWVFALPLFLLAVLPIADVPRPGVAAVAISLVVTFAIVWSINLHNFMDGINGLLTAQAIFVLSGLAVLAFARGGRSPLPFLIGVAACAGFLPFNFPRARVFMGDVGSGVTGFVIGIGVLAQMTDSRIAVMSGLILCSAFVTDATCTLLSRMLQGRRWYSAHREHLYQWLVRAGFSHARVVALYMGWNVLIVLPTLLWINRPNAGSGGWLEAAAIYALGIMTWWFGKRWCLRHVAHGGTHAPA